MPPPLILLTLHGNDRILAQMASSKTIAVNRRAFHDYHILDRLEAGIVLTGSEIKSVRAGTVNLRDAYAKVENNELWLLNAHIARYKAASRDVSEPARRRKLLLHRKQIDNLTGMTVRKGLTIVPLKLYIKNGVAKVELGIVRGKKLYDKREAIRSRELDRETDRMLKAVGRRR